MNNCKANNPTSLKGMKIRASLLIAALALTVGSANAAVVIKPGSLCTKVGATATYKNLKFTCIASGKKKVWNKGVPVVAPKPTPAPTATSTPTPAPTPTPTATPTPTPAEPFKITTFDEAIAHPESIAYWAWKKSAAKIKGATDAGPTVVIHAGPNTKVLTTRIVDAIIATTRLYSGFTAPSTVHAIYYNYADIAWGQAEFAKYALRPSGREAANQCQSELDCWGALAEIDLRGNGIILAALSKQSNVDFNHTSGTLESHEYAHTIQASQFVGTAKEVSSHCCIKAYLPYWSVEGGAEFAQAASNFIDSFDAYKNERANDTNEVLHNADGTFTQSWLENYLAPGAIAMWNSSGNNWRMYDVGFLVDEILTALKGPDVVMQINRDVATGSTWQQAFESNMGVSWSEAAPKIASAIRAEMVR